MDSELESALATALEEVAADATERSGLRVAAHLLERASAFAHDPDRQTALLARGADAFVRSGDTRQAGALLRRIGAVDDPEVAFAVARARAASARAEGDLAGARELLTDEAERLEATAPRLAARLFTGAAIVEFLGQSGDASAWAERASALTPDDPLPVLVAGAMRTPPTGGFGARDLEPVLDAVLRFEDLLDVADELIYGPMLSLMLRGEFDPALALGRAVVARARDLEALPLLADALSAVGGIAFKKGDWDDAYADLTEAVALGERTGQRTIEAQTLLWVARIEAARGLERECRAHVARARHFGLAGGEGADVRLDSILRLLELSLDRPERALEYPPDRANPNHACDWVEAAIRLGRADEAAETLTWLERDARPMVRAAAARCRGLLAEDEEFERAFTSASKLHDLSPSAFERARTDLCLGERLRRSSRGVEARRPLTSALEGFEALGARPWADRARRELAATGLRVQPEEQLLTSLTPHEAAVARLVAAGSTNREAAAALFVSLKTIEFHLAKIYRKLDVRSRTELARLLAAGAPDERPS